MLIHAHHVNTDFTKSTFMIQRESCCNVRQVPFVLQYSKVLCVLERYVFKEYAEVRTKLGIRVRNHVFQ